MRFDEPFGGIIPGARGAVLAALLRTGAPLTGRQLYRLLQDDFSLWTVQEALKALTKIGLVSTETVGRAGVHSVNDEHYAIGPLRSLVNPIAALTGIVEGIVGDDVHAVIVFGSVGRGAPGPDSDVDLAVIAEAGWDDRVRIQNGVRAGLGNDCDVLAFTSAEFSRLAADGEPVVTAILTDGVPLIGSMPRIRSGAA